MRQKGFTLIELLIALVIMSILVMFAVPSYLDYVTRSRLSDGTSNLAAYRIQMEQAYADNGNYGGGACAVALPASQYFTYACGITNGGQSYTATATGVAAFNLNGYAFTLDAAGNQVTTAYPGAAVPRPCWLVKVGDC